MRRGSDWLVRDILPDPVSFNTDHDSRAMEIWTAISFIERIKA